MRNWVGNGVIRLVERAIANDLRKTVQVLGRFGPELPDLVKAAIRKQTEPTPPPVTVTRWRYAALISAGTALLLLGVVLGELL